MKSIFYNGSNFVKVESEGWFFLWANHFMCYSWFVNVSLGNNDAMQLKEGKDWSVSKVSSPKIEPIPTPLQSDALEYFAKYFLHAQGTEISFLCVFQGICRWNENHHKHTPHIRGCPTAPRRGWSRWPHTSRCLAACGPTIRKRTATNKNHWGHSQDGLVANRRKTNGWLYTWVPAICFLRGVRGLCPRMTWLFRLMWFTQSPVEKWGRNSVPFLIRTAEPSPERLNNYTNWDARV